MRTLVVLMWVSVALAMGSPTAHAASLKLAEALLERGDVAAALDEVKARVAEAPKEVASHELLIDILFATGRSELCLELYRDLARNNAGEPDFLYLLGRASPDADSSESAYRAALALDPMHARAAMGVAAVHRARGEWAAAVERYEDALRGDVSLSEAWTGLRSSHLGAGDSTSAESVVRRQIAAFPDELTGWSVLAELDSTDAVEIWREACAARPDDSNRRGELARAAFEAGKWKLAAKNYDRAIDDGAEQAPAMRAERAIIDEILSKAISPAGAAALLAVRGMVQNNATAALALLDRLAEEEPHSGWVRLVRGNLYRGSGRMKQAEEDLRAALDRMPASPDVWSALGLFLLDQRRADEAQMLLKKAAAARPSDVSIVVASAMALGESGATDEADVALQSAMGRFPGNPGPVLGLARLRLSSGDPDGAFEVLHEALRLGPEVSIAYALVSAAQEAGRPDEALRILRALASETGDPRFARAAEGLSNSIEAAKQTGISPE